ncbi:MAG: hypothetical protein COU32_01530 [Candidatus Magasanikbacteria bacterium CG10_big_fil_rev_8_21_14_0_10_42_10]|uniref:Type 4 fimbrial biogenesis protein PilX N-terminal domain-containing protein n=2 Tax=Candidatus Magasanikiibacteriota TaxID=1752731 RepID=A0A2H0TYD6_9BACT|nr:MAG: hypothetical protein COU32_01530 [Candidatus Magasanikbacteria bacterium CG10_big_fil_rev_8_21_14_0_10_42_10]PIZ94038.1 MAG: hypothetical protein COX82_01440 [Candidatus Magasanikbacteria bacterium CG_4_10_14_0_2_um_filter_41_10]
MFQWIRDNQKRVRQNVRGSLLLFVMIFGSVAFTLIVLGVSSYAMFENQASNKKQFRDLSFHIAEAGVNYYRWHLAHSPEDYQDGTGVEGPYVHEFQDKDGNVIGYFSLDIVPPLTGTTIVSIRSTGWVASQEQSSRTIAVRVGYPALTDFSFVENSEMRFSQTSIVHGKLHSNDGIEFNGITDSIMQSAKETYNPQYGPADSPGIWGDGGPTTFWDFPVPPKDFNAITTDLASIRDASDAGGLHFYSSGKEGYHMIFQADGTFKLYTVTKRQKYTDYCKTVYNGYCYSGNVYYDIQNETYDATYAIPANGAIFVEDDIWVEGVVNGHVSVGAGRFPVLESTYQEIYPIGDITLLEKESTNVIGLIAQGDIVYPYNVPNDMVVEAALLSQFKKIYRPYFSNTKNSLTIFGSQISYDGGGVKWGNPVVSGFINTIYIYDGNLRYLVPPGFPVEPTYELISWEEIE